MKPVVFPEVNFVFTRPPHPEYESIVELPVHLNHTPYHPSITSCWELSQEDMQLIRSTGRVYLTVFGNTTPPVNVCVKPPFMDVIEN